MMRKEVMIAIYKNNLEQAESKLTSMRYESDSERIKAYASSLQRISEFAQPFQVEYGAYFEEIKKEHDTRVASHIQGLLTRLVKDMQQRTACIREGQPLSTLNPRAYAHFAFAA